MLRHLRSWLVPILALLMVAGIGLSLVPLTKNAEARAERELTNLMDRALEHVSAGARLIAPVIAAEKESLVSKAEAVARFLAHDDAFLQSDALKALCGQLTIDIIDVADAEGTLIASSEEARVALPLGAQKAFLWTMDTADDANAALSESNEAHPSVLYACVGRSDIEGFVLLTRDDPFVFTALTESGYKASIMDLTYGSDVVFQTDIAGEDGFFRDSGSLCLRRTDDGITLIAARPLTDVFAARNAALIAFVAALVCIVICSVASYLLRLEPLVTLEEEEMQLEPGEENGASNGGETEPKETDEPPQDMPQETGRPKHKQRRKPAQDTPKETCEEPFEKIVE